MDATLHFAALDNNIKDITCYCATNIFGSNCYRTTILAPGHTPPMMPQISSPSCLHIKRDLEVCLLSVHARVSHFWQRPCSKDGTTRQCDAYACLVFRVSEEQARQLWRRSLYDPTASDTQRHASLVYLLSPVASSLQSYCTPRHMFIRADACLLGRRVNL